MRFRVLAILPLVWGAAFLLGGSFLYGTPEYTAFVRAEIDLAKGLALIGSVAALLAFQPGDYLRRAWALMSLNMLLLLAADGLLVFLGRSAYGGLPRGLVVVAANITMVVGVWFLASTWKVANLSLSGSKAGRIAVVAGMIIIALAVGLPMLLSGVQRLRAGDLTALAGIASTLGDIATLSLVAPLLLTALALRGGLFVWPWALLTSSFVGWVAYDVFTIPGVNAFAGDHFARTASEFFRGVACLYGFSAGLAQRWIVKQVAEIRS